MYLVVQVLDVGERHGRRKELRDTRHDVGDCLQGAHGAVDLRQRIRDVPALAGECDETVGVEISNLNADFPPSHTDRDHLAGCRPHLWLYRLRHTLQPGGSLGIHPLDHRFHLGDGAEDEELDSRQLHGDLLGTPRNGACRRSRGAVVREHVLVICQFVHAGDGDRLRAFQAGMLQLDGLDEGHVGLGQLVVALPLGRNGRQSEHSEHDEK